MRSVRDKILKLEDEIYQISIEINRLKDKKYEKEQKLNELVFNRSAY